MKSSEQQPLPSEELRRRVFERLVSLQDQGTAVRDSRSLAGQEFGLSVDQVMAIEDEGMLREWPPLESS